MPKETLAEQLATLQSAMKEAVVPSFVSGTIGVPAENLIVFYGKSDATARRIDLSNASDAELETLAQCCDAATFGRNDENVLDETYRKAGKLDATDFCVSLDLQTTGLLDIVGEWLQDTGRESPRIRAERYKLNVYGKDAFFKAHQDTPRGEEMFGSLVVVYPTQHDGGALLLREKGKEWTFDSAEEIAQHHTKGSCVAYVAFYSDVEHEVDIVRSGYRVTMTYNLYFASTTRKPVQSSPRLLSNELVSLKEAFTKLLQDRHFLPKGGYLGFGLRQEYPLPRNDPGSRGFVKLVNYNDRLKGFGALLMAAAKSVGLKPKLNLWFPNPEYYYDGEYSDGILCDFIPRDRDWQEGDDETDIAFLHHWGGKRVGKVPKHVEAALEKFYNGSFSSEDEEEDKPGDQSGEDEGDPAIGVLAEKEDGDGGLAENERESGEDNNSGDEGSLEDDKMKLSVSDMGSEEYYAGFRNTNWEVPKTTSDVEWYQEVLDPTPIDMEVLWVSKPESTVNDKIGHQIQYITYGNEVGVEYHYGKLCLIVEVGSKEARQLIASS